MAASGSGKANAAVRESTPAPVADADDGGGAASGEEVGERLTTALRELAALREQLHRAEVAEAQAAARIIELAGEAMAARAATRVQAAFHGFNATCFAYGQTSSGKSYSMIGKLGGSTGISEHSGLTPRVAT